MNASIFLQYNINFFLVELAVVALVWGKIKNQLQLELQLKSRAPSPFSSHLRK